jgi:hypothetical protein
MQTIGLGNLPKTYNRGDAPNANDGTDHCIIGASEDVGLIDNISRLCP